MKRTSATARLLGGLAAASLAAAALACGTSDADAAPITGPTLVTTDKGRIQGTAADGVRSWLGVPYASPPTGGLRWASPEPAEPWEGVRAADEFGSACAQGLANMPGVPSEEEDCLYLNVYAPEDRTAALPVMVWFHGGGNSYGAASQYDPSRLVTDGDVVVVTVNYRQGLFGSMSHPALDGEDGEIRSGDYGLQDQRAALAWTRSNAAAFGGDGQNVTVFGESGGGFDVCAHLASPGSADLFDKAIMQSAPCASAWAPTRAEGQARDIAVAESLGCDDPATAAECLRALEPAALNDATAGLFEVQPVIGGPIMPIATREALETGAFSPVPVLIGINRDEEQLMTAGQELLTGRPITAEDYRAALERAFGEAADAVAERYPVESYDNPAMALAAVQTDAHWAHDLAVTTDLLADRTPTFVYELAIDDAPWFHGLDRPEWTLGAYHMVDVAFLFDTDIFEPRNAEHDRLADVMIDHWSTFARTGAPDEAGRWEPADRDRDVRRLSPEGASNIDFDDEHRVEFWRGVLA